MHLDLEPGAPDILDQRIEPVVELRGFEPVTPSLRKMRSNALTRGLRAISPSSCASAAQAR
jgi:hypothetical protein